MLRYLGSILSNDWAEKFRDIRGAHPTDEEASQCQRLHCHEMSMSTK